MNINKIYGKTGLRRSRGESQKQRINGFTPQSSSFLSLSSPRSPRLCVKYFFGAAG
jgi:hypothetical protein